MVEFTSQCLFFPISQVEKTIDNSQNVQPTPGRLTGAKRREFSGMIHWLTINNHPSNPIPNPPFPAVSTSKKMETYGTIPKISAFFHANQGPFVQPTPGRFLRGPVCKVPHPLRAV